MSISTASRLRDYDGKQYVRVSTDKEPDEEYGHNHPIYLDNDAYVLGLVNGHTHTVDQEAAGRVLGRRGAICRGVDGA